MRLLVSLALAAFAATPVLADEFAIKLKDGPGVDVVTRNCSACHSLDYPVSNSAFLDGKGWDAEVTKMIKVFGAQIDDSDAKSIKDYLATNYGK
jgi:sulfite dehydrogenase (cytochrome) subunit B